MVTTSSEQVAEKFFIFVDLIPPLNYLITPDGPTRNRLAVQRDGIYRITYNVNVSNPDPAPGLVFTVITYINDIRYIPASPTTFNGSILQSINLIDSFLVPIIKNNPTDQFSYITMSVFTETPTSPNNNTIVGRATVNIERISDIPPISVSLF